MARAARASGGSANTLLSRVRRWVRWGLLHPVRTERHPRGRMQVYRSSAQGYFVPYHATRAEDLRALAEQVYLPAFEHLLARYAGGGEALGGDWGLLFTPGSHGNWSIAPRADPRKDCSPLDAALPPLLLEAAILRLDAADAKALQRELHDVIVRYRAREGRGEYHLLVGLA
ncbi:hypothetical protein HNR42_001571 [Deinobacterium chartae]|uniref:Uncharacterized protein n=1 Tax=Deinobacterium chartae TaxID=521158 RepID=A0A841HZ46_9DEIO|nr:hypothetical protein [Deinobacterium chartae]MBB6098146.1 hypothetical protein [Deinobacterium chartae]